MPSHRMKSLMKEAAKGTNPQVTSKDLSESYDLQEMKEQLVTLAHKNTLLRSQLTGTDVAHKEALKNLKKMTERLEHLSGLELKYTKLLKEYGGLKAELDNVLFIIERLFGKVGVGRYTYHRERL